MSLQVVSFDDRKAEAELKKCPKIVRDYVKLLKQRGDRWQVLTRNCIIKLKSK